MPPETTTATSTTIEYNATPPHGSPTDDACRELVSAASRILANAGHGDLIWGHASLRDPAGRGAWIKSAEWGLEEVTPTRVHLLDPAGDIVAGEGIGHSEWPIHLEILAARTDVNAVVHTHSPHATALAASGQTLRPVSHAANMFVPPDVPRFTVTGDLILTPELGQALAASLGHAPAVFLVNHGIVTVGSTIEEATVRAVILERACEQQLLTVGYGGMPSWSSPEESVAKRDHIYNERAVLAVWRYLVRALV